ncbi:MAG: hypothetical protein ABR594_16125 [Pyrinomonadaceae bacterium]
MKPLISLVLCLVFTIVGQAQSTLKPPTEPVLDRFLRYVNAMEAARRAGLKAFMKPIRGGTDGARLTFRGLPTPNLFTGGSNFHGKLEFNSRRGLEKSTETLINLVQIFAEKS